MGSDEVERRSGLEPGDLALVEGVLERDREGFFSSVGRPSHSGLQRLALLDITYTFDGDLVLAYRIELA